jgi:hypothetical protein
MVVNASESLLIFQKHKNKVYHFDENNQSTQECRQVGGKAFTIETFVQALHIV